MFSDEQFIYVPSQQLDIYNPNLKLFEQRMKQEYSLGTSLFTIDHGDDYFKFFKRLGTVHYFIIQDPDTKIMVGTGCAILRPGNIWYLCDMKIEEAYRGQGLTQSLFMKMFFAFYNISPTGYLITMDNKDGKNGIVHIFKKINIFLKINIGPKLLIYMINTPTYHKIKSLLNKEFGLIRFLSLNGIKDLIISNTQIETKLKVYHLQHHNQEGVTEPPPDAIIMFCLIETKPLVKELTKLGVITDVSATIISSGLDNFDFILTSDI